MKAKTIGLILAIFLLTITILACADGGTSSSGSSSGGGGEAVLKLLPDDTSLIFTMAVGEVTGGSVPESMTELFEERWEYYSLGGDDEIVTVDDIDKIVWAGSPEGEIVMLSGSQMNFEAISDWLADEDTNVERTSYQGEEIWGGDTVAMVLLQGDGYLVIGDTDAVKELLKVKARGTGSLAGDSENALKKAYEDAAKGWYVSVANDCDQFFSNLRSCEAYSITGSRGKEDFLVNVTYRFVFRSEQRAESQSLDVEDEIEEWNLRWDIDEVKTDGASVEVRMSGDEEDFIPRWLAINIIPTPPPLPRAAPKSDSNTSTGASATAPGQTRTAPAAASQEEVVPWPPGEPTMAPPQFYDSDSGMGSVDGPEASWERLDSCLVELRSTGSLVGKWDGSCYSPRTGLQAHYYTFSLPRDAFVEITVSPDDAGYRTSMEGHFERVSGQVVVLAGEGMDGEVLVEDNYQYRDVLPAGTYTIEATHKNDGELFPVEYFELRFSVE